MSEPELRRCWNCKQWIDKDPCPICTKAKADFSNADIGALNAHLMKMANS